eukprot:GAFH01002706.1.p3 GENE.GAFH01002706.1~~GAFH01002706.1.p3  ORF type:complete len:239 (+),score=12.78 GAFH01002706.1:90-806(+)
MGGLPSRCDGRCQMPRCAWRQGRGLCGAQTQRRRDVLFGQKRDSLATAADPQNVLLQIDDALVSLEVVEAKEEVLALALEDSERGRQNGSSNFQGCHMDPTKDFALSDAHRHSLESRVDQAHNPASLRAGSRHNRVLGAGIHESLEWNPVDKAVDVQHHNLTKGLWEIFESVVEVLGDVLLTDESFDLPLGVEIHGVGGHYSLQLLHFHVVFMFNLKVVRNVVGATRQQHFRQGGIGP